MSSVSVYTDVGGRRGVEQGRRGAGSGAAGERRSASHARLGSAGAPQQPGTTPHHLFCKPSGLHSNFPQQ